MGRPAVTGAAALEIDLAAREVRVRRDRSCTRATSSRSTAPRARITTDDVPLGEPPVSEHFADGPDLGATSCAPSGCARTPTRPRTRVKAREFGAEGIGLCRTEHMFLGDRQPLMADVILAATDEDRDRRLERLRPLQEEDFDGLFAAMEGLPVTIRLLDPPLHEFLPHRHVVEQEVERARIEASDDLPRLEQTLERVSALQETNPMLGTRGVRLGILHPEIYDMQVRAIFAAAVRVRDAPAGRAPAVVRDHDPARGLRAWSSSSCAG